MYYVYYTFKNDEPNKAYVGMSIKPFTTGYKGSGEYLINAFKKYEKKAFTRTDLGMFNNKEEAHYWEGFYIKTLKTLVSQGGYNICPKGGLGCPGDKMSEESRRKIASANKGKKMSEETRKKLSKSLTGIFPSEETRKKLSESHKGEKHHFFGKSLSQNHKKKMSEAKKGKVAGMKGKHHSDETKKKIGKANQGLHRSSEAIEKIRNGNTGKKISEETRAKMRKIMKGKTPWNKGLKISK